MTTATAPGPATGPATTVREHIPAPPEIIAERFRGLMTSIVDNPHGPEHLRRLEDNSKLYYRLDRALGDLVYGLLQNDLQDTAEDIVQDLHEVIRQEAIRRVVESQRASWAGEYPENEATR